MLHTIRAEPCGMRRACFCVCVLVCSRVVCLTACVCVCVFCVCLCVCVMCGVSTRRTRRAQQRRCAGAHHGAHGVTNECRRHACVPLAVRRYTQHGLGASGRAQIKTCVWMHEHGSSDLGAWEQRPWRMGAAPYTCKHLPPQPSRAMCSRIGLRSGSVAEVAAKLTGLPMSSNEKGWPLLSSATPLRAFARAGVCT